MKDIVSHLTEKAEKLKKERKFEEAIQITDKAKEIKESEKSSDFWYKRAVQCCELGEYEEAIDCYNMLIQRLGLQDIIEKREKFYEVNKKLNQSK